MIGFHFLEKYIFYNISLFDLIPLVRLALIFRFAETGSETPQLHNFIQILPMIILSFVVWADPLGRAGTYGTRPSERCAGAYASPLAAPTRGRSGPRAGVRGYPRA